MLLPTGRRVVEQPHPNEFADMLEDIFSGNCSRPMDQAVLTETPWSMSELMVAIKRAKDQRTRDALGLAASCWIFATCPESYLKHLLKDFVMVMPSVVVKSLHRRKLRFSRCFQNLPLQNLHQTSVPLLACLCCTKFSPTLCWDRWKVLWKTHNQKSNTVFENDGGLKNTCWRQICVCRKHWRQTSRYGSWALIFRRRLIK